MSSCVVTHIQSDTSPYIMTPNHAAYVIQRAWFAWCRASEENELDMNDLWPERPVDWDGIHEVIFEYY
jgi:hypothetical protein